MGLSISKITKPFRNAAKSLAPVGHLIGGRILGTAMETIGETSGDSAERNSQKRADFEYARSLADQYAFQNDSVQRRVADAKSAGIHPLAALGYQAPSFIPPQTDTGYYPDAKADMESLGQDISRAISAGQTEKERQGTLAMQATVDNLAIRRMQLEVQGLEIENIYRAERLNRMRAGNPAFPDVNAIRNVGVSELGQGDIARYGMGMDKSGGPAATIIENRDGTTSIVPSEKGKQLTEDNLWHELKWMYHNEYVPWLNNEMNLIDKHTIQPLKNWYSRTFPQRRTGNVRSYR